MLLPRLYVVSGLEWDDWEDWEVTCGGAVQEELLLGRGFKGSEIMGDDFK